MATLQNWFVLPLLVLLEEEQIIQLVKMSPLIYAMNEMKLIGVQEAKLDMCN